MYAHAMDQPRPPRRPLRCRWLRPPWIRDGRRRHPDARSLRGLAHPLRLQLLGLLRSDGPATATQLAVRTGQSSGATSYHLRQLAAYGFVIEDAERTTGRRERYWRAAHRDLFDLPLMRTRRARRWARSTCASSPTPTRATSSRRSRARHGRERPRAGLAGRLHDERPRASPDPGRGTALIAELEAVAVRYRRENPDDRITAPPTRSAWCCSSRSCPPHPRAALPPVEERSRWLTPRRAVSDPPGPGRPAGRQPCVHPRDPDVDACAAVVHACHDGQRRQTGLVVFAEWPLRAGPGARRPGVDRLGTWRTSIASDRRGLIFALVPVLHVTDGLSLRRGGPGGRGRRGARRETRPATCWSPV